MAGLIHNFLVTTQRICGKCGASVGPLAPDNLCLNCLLESALNAESEVQTTATTLEATEDTLLPTPAKSEIQKPKSEMGSPTRFADYELLEEIARGGMGVVYRARQISLGRIVAVKMLPFGALASQETVQRFRIEAAAAASLQHPQIVAIYEVGFHDGQHFFAMEYVAGRSLAAIVKDGPLPPKRAAAWLKTIAEAIHYAHERNILHRDLKPSNILIDQFDQPKVTDFGLAKRLETEPELTLSGQLLGSPNYMSPEQAAAKRGTVGRRSDVYALGAILYHLLTGRPPFVAPTVAETLQEVLNTEPVSPRVLNPGVPRDLETICLKCLEKDSARRYDTADALARDIERHLNNEPVAARPPSRLYRFQKLARRNRLAFAAAGAVTAALILGLASSTWEYFKERKARQRATAVSSLLQQLLNSTDPEGLKGPSYTVREMLDDFSTALTNQSELTVEPEVEATVRLAIGWGYYKRGAVDDAERNLRKAVELRSRALGPEHLDTLEAKDALASSLAGSYRKWEEAAKLAFETWQARRRLLGPENTNTLKSAHSYAGALMEGGRSQEAEPVERQVLQIRQSVLPPDDLDIVQSLGTLGQILISRGSYADAEGYFRQALASLQRIGYADKQDGIICAKEIALCHLQQGDLAEALKRLEELSPRAITNLGPDDRLTLLVQRVLARALAENGELDRAEALCRETLQRRLHSKASQELYGTARTQLTLGRVLAEQGKLDEAERVLQDALQFFREDPACKPRPELAAQAANWLGAVHLVRRQYTNAEPLLLSGTEQFFAPTSDMTPNERRVALGHIIQLYQAWGKPEHAVEWQKKAEQLPK